MSRFNRNAAKHQPFGQDITGIREDLKIKINHKLDQLLKDDNLRVIEFPKGLTNNERKYIHNYCIQFKLNTKSFGFGDERYITVSKRDTNSKENSLQSIELTLSSQQVVINLRQYLKQTNNLKPNVNRFNTNFGQNSNQFYGRTGRLSNIRPQVPRVEPFVEQFRKELPIYEFRNDILAAIQANQVVIISGDTGCGKTTQVPQYLLEYSAQFNTPCRIVCAEPRRLAAISVSERICVERNEQTGRTVGYQIRLESRVSDETVLTFCTNGVILRTLMSNREDFLRNTTHIIIDEVHERDRFSDFLLLIMKQIIEYNTNIKLILMSATFNIKRFADYFNNTCPILEIPGRQHKVDEYFLEDVLKAIDYMSLDMAKHKQALDRSRRLKQSLGTTSAVDQQLPDITPVLSEECDILLKKAWDEGSDQSFDELLDLVSRNRCLIDYMHSQSNVTALACAAARNKLQVVEALVCFGADPDLKMGNDMTAFALAERFSRQEICSYLASVSSDVRKSEAVVGRVLTDDEKELLEIYHHCFNDDAVDCKLICALILYIMTNTRPDGAILVFLPGLEDILTVRDSIMSDGRGFGRHLFEVFILHSQMQSKDQKRVFNRLAANKRKIILSTNIAETSLTIDDVVFVIDSGKVKEKSFDSLMGISSLKSVWISQSSVRQRRGRAGRTRPGVCYHLFSSIRYQSLQRHQLPEILRIPIHELCLQTKLLVPNNDMSIHQFLSSAMDPPSITSVRASVQLLKTIDALDSREQLTQLGVRLLDLPIEPHFGKMIFYSIILKCVEPVLTIVSSLTYRDPFMLPPIGDKQKTSKETKKRFCPKMSFSDHSIYLTAFNRWSEIPDSDQRRQFCFQNLISNNTMELIDGIRNQLTAQLVSTGFIQPNSVDHNANADNWPAIKACLTAGAYPKLICFDEESGQFRCQNDKIKFHGSSQLNFDPNTERFVGNYRKVNQIMPTNWYIYEELVQIGRTSYAKCLTAVSAITIALFSGKPYVPDQKSAGDEFIAERAHLQIDNWIDLVADGQTIKIVEFLKQELHNLFIRRIETNSRLRYAETEADKTIVEAVINVLTEEDMDSGFGELEVADLRPQLGANSYRHKFQRQHMTERQFRSDKRRFKTNQRFN